MNLARQIIDKLPSSILLTLSDFAQCLIFWLASFLITCAIDYIGILTLPKGWFIPISPLIAAFLVAAAIFALQIPYLLSPKEKPSWISKLYLWILRSCNKNIALVGTNTAAIIFWLYALTLEHIQDGILVVLCCLLLSLISTLFQQLNPPKEQISLQK